MSDETEDCDVVQISTPGEDDDHFALAEPQFIVKKDGKFYITFACWEYDPHAEGLPHHEHDAIEKVRDLFEKSEAGPVEARLVKSGPLQPMCSAGKFAERSRHKSCGRPPTPTRPHRRLPRSHDDDA